MRVHLLRHGEVENPTRVRYGRLPGFGLSERGRAEVERSARALASRLGDVAAPLRAIVSSPLERARESAAIVREILEAPEPRFDARLTEASEWREGLPRSLAPRETLSRLLTPATWPPNEAPLEIARRMWSAVSEVVETWKEGDVLLVSHQTPIRLVRLAFERGLASGTAPPLVRLLPRAFSRYACATGSVTTLVFEGARFAASEYRETGGR